MDSLIVILWFEPLGYLIVTLFPVCPYYIMLMFLDFLYIFMYRPVLIKPKIKLKMGINFPIMRLPTSFMVIGTTFSTSLVPVVVVCITSESESPNVLVKPPIPLPASFTMCEIPSSIPRAKFPLVTW